MFTFYGLQEVEIKSKQLPCQTKENNSYIAG